MSIDSPDQHWLEEADPADAEVQERLDRLLEQARESRRADYDEPVLEQLGREIDLTVAHLRSLDELERNIRRSLSKSECMIGTEILRLNVPPRTYLPPYNRERWSLERGLLKVASERRQLAMAMHERRRALADRLATLLNRRRQVRY